MRVVMRSLGATCLAVLSAIVLALAWTTTTAVHLAATALIMGGTDHPLSSPADDPVSFINPYMSNAVSRFINPAAAAPTGTGGDPIGSVADGDDRYAVITPEQFFPIFGSMTFDDSVVAGLTNLSRCVRGSDDCDYNEDPAIEPGPPADPPIAGDEFVIFGYSQSAVIASLLKQDLIDNPEDAPSDLSFFLLSNPMRPNGGFLSRGPEGLTIPILGVTFYGATPTDSCETGDCYETVDVAAQYDGLGGDAAVGLTNVLAVLNATVGFLLLHSDMEDASFEDALYQGSHGDTDYYIVPTKRLPILMLFEDFIPSPILTALDSPLRAAIEGAYARDVNPGIATKVGLLPFLNPVQAILNIIRAIPTGIDDAIAEATGDPTNRPLGTDPVTSPFGVGGPELPEPPSTEDGAALAMSARIGDDAVEPIGPDEDVVEPYGSDTEGAATEEEVAEEEVTEEEVAEEEVAEEEATEEDVTEEEVAEQTTTGADTPPVTQHDQPKMRGPIEFDSQDEPETAPATQPGDGQTTADEPDSSPDDAAGEAAA
jgi:PE-PPE domain